MRALICFMVFTCFMAEAWATEIELKLKETKKVVLEDVMAPISLEVLEPHEQKNRKFQAVDLTKVLDKTFGDQWRNEEELLITCADGYQPSLPVKLIRENKAYLAVSREGADFQITNTLQNNEKVNLAPAYLIWDNKHNKTIQSHGAGIWPYQITRLEFVKFKDRFAKMAPAEKSSPAVLEGFLAFRHYCQSCHRINGQGGEKSIELNYPMNITEYYKPEILRKWIDSPQSVRWGTVMPPLNPDAPAREKVLDNLMAYLSAMKTKKIKPE